MQRAFLSAGPVRCTGLMLMKPGLTLRFLALGTEEICSATKLEIQRENSFGEKHKWVQFGAS